MSYVFDIMSRAWNKLRDELPPEIRDSEASIRFGMLVEEMHEANHRLKDAVNHDARVRDQARRLDDVVTGRWGT